MSAPWLQARSSRFCAKRGLCRRALADVNRAAIFAWRPHGSGGQLWPGVAHVGGCGGATRALSWPERRSASRMKPLAFRSSMNAVRNRMVPGSRVRLVPRPAGSADSGIAGDEAADHLADARAGAQALLAEQLDPVPAAHHAGLPQGPGQEQVVS
jgi:hypothetical protein